MRHWRWTAARALAAAAMSLAVMCAPLAAQAQSRVALVIGNGDYARDSWDLRAGDNGYGPVNGARLMEDVLDALGFDVERVENADQASLLDALASFGERIRNAGPDAVSFFYYAGHGVRVGEQNYLLPTNLQAQYREDVVARSVPLYQVMEMLALKDPGSRHIVVLDACQDPGLRARNPTANIDAGLTEIDWGRVSRSRPPRVLLGFATQPGSYALAGAERYSPYTEALADALRNHGGRTADAVFVEVADRVERATQTDRITQIPYHTNNLRTSGGFYFGLSPEEEALALLEEAGFTINDRTDFNRAVEQVRADNALLPAGPVDRAFATALRLLVKGLGYRAEGAGAGPTRRLDGPVDDALTFALSIIGPDAVAASGSDDAGRQLTNLGYDYSTGTDGKDQNDRFAVRLYHGACERGYALGCSNLGDMYRLGRGVALDESKAALLFGEGCDGGSGTGCTNLGWMYEQGRGVDQDFDESVRLYRLGCDRGSAPGCTNLGGMYYAGRGVERNFSTSERFYRQGCEGGNPRGCTNLATQYHNGEGVELDYSEALRLHQQGCDGGDGLGCAYLGDLYEDGKGVDTNIEEAVRLYRRALQLNPQTTFAKNALRRLGESP